MVNKFNKNNEWKKQENGRDGYWDQKTEVALNSASSSFEGGGHHNAAKKWSRQAVAPP